MTDTISTVSKVEADLIVRDRAADYVDEFGGDTTIDEFPFWAARLSNDVGAALDPGWLREVVFHMEQVTAAENGTHPVLKVNAARTVDNTEAVIEWETHLLNTTINTLLKTAGFTGAKTTGTGKQAA